MKKLTTTERLLFVAPLLLVPLGWLIQKSGVTPRASLPPAPTPTPRPLRLTEKLNNWYSVVVSPDGKQIITGSDFDGSGFGVQVWDAQSLELITTFGAPLSPSYFAITPDGQHLVVGRGGQDSYHGLVFNLRNRKKTVELDSDGVFDFSLSHDGKLVALTSRGNLDIREVKTGRLLRSLRSWLPTSHDSELGPNAFSLDGKRIAVVDDLERTPDVSPNGKRDEIGIFSLHSGRRLRRFSWPYADIRNIAFSPDGKFLAVVVWIYKPASKKSKAQYQQSQQILLCDARTGRVRRTLSTKEQMHALAFSSDSRWLAVGSAGKGVQVWNMKNGTLQLNYRGQSAIGGDYVNSLCFTPDNRKLLVATMDKFRILSVPQHHN